MAQVGSLQRLYETYKDRVEFILVYVREAHPGSILSLPTKGGRQEIRIVAQTPTVTERLHNLRQLIALKHLTMPAGIDGDDAAAKRAYSGWPDRLYVIDADGKIALKGLPGPFGFKVPQIEEWLSDNVK